MSSEYERIKREVLARRERSSGLLSLIDDPDHNNLLDRLKAQEVSLSKQSMSIRSMLVRMNDEVDAEPIHHAMESSALRSSSPVKHRSNQVTLDSIKRIENRRVSARDDGDVSHLDLGRSRVRQIEELEATSRLRLSSRKPKIVQEEIHVPTRSNRHSQSQLQDILPLSEDDPVYQAQHELQRLRQQREHTLQERIQKQAEAVEMMERMREEAIERAKRERSFNKADSHYRQTHQIQAFSTLRSHAKHHKRARLLKIRIEYQSMKDYFRHFMKTLQHRRRIKLKGYYLEISLGFSRVKNALKCNVYLQQRQLKDELMADRHYYTNLAKKALYQLTWTKRFQMQQNRRGTRYYDAHLLKHTMTKWTKRYRQVTKPIIEADYKLQAYLREKSLAQVQQLLRCFQWNAMDQRNEVLAEQFYVDSFRRRNLQHLSYMASLLKGQREHVDTCKKHAILTLKKRYFMRLYRKVARYSSNLKIPFSKSRHPLTLGSLQSRQIYEAERQQQMVKSFVKDSRSILAKYFHLFHKRVLMNNRHINAVVNHVEGQPGNYRLLAAYYASRTKENEDEDVEFPHAAKERLQSYIHILGWKKLWFLFSTSLHYYQSLHQSHVHDMTAATAHHRRSTYLTFLTHLHQLIEIRRNLARKCSQRTHLRKFHHTKRDIVLDALTKLTKYAQMKKLHKVKGRRHYEQFQQKLFFDIIKTRLFRKYEIRERMEKAEYWTRLRKGYLVRWRMLTMFKRHSKGLVQVMQDKKRRNMKSNGLELWRGRHLQIMEEDTKYTIAKLHWRRSSVKRVIRQMYNATFRYHTSSHFQQAGNESEKGRTSQQSSQKKGNSTTGLTLDSVPTLLTPWQDRLKYLTIQKKRPAVIVIKRMLQQWSKVFVQKRLHQRKVLKKQAVICNNGNLLRQGWKQWREHYHEAMEQEAWLGYYRMNVQIPMLQARFFKRMRQRRMERDEENAVIEGVGRAHYVRTCAQVLLSEWKIRVQNRLYVTKQQRNIARQHYRRYQLQQAISNWVEHSASQFHIGTSIKLGHRHYRKAAFTPNILQWHQFTVQKQQNRENKATAMKHDKSKLFKNLCRALKQSLIRHRKQKQAIQRATNYRKLYLLKVQFFRFVRKLKARLAHKKKSKIARQRYRRGLLHAIFHKGFKVIYQEYLMKHANIMNAAVSLFHKSLRHRYIKLWAKKQRTLRNYRAQLYQLQYHCITRRFFYQQWFLRYHKNSKKAKIDMNSCKLFLYRKRCKVYLKKWKRFVARKKLNIQGLCMHDVFQALPHNHSIGKLNPNRPHPSHTVVTVSSVVMSPRRKQALLQSQAQERKKFFKKRETTPSTNMGLTSSRLLAHTHGSADLDLAGSEDERIVKIIRAWMRTLLRPNNLQFMPKPVLNTGNSTKSSKGNLLRSSSTDSVVFPSGSLTITIPACTEVPVKTSREVMTLVSHKVRALHYFKHWRDHMSTYSLPQKESYRSAITHRGKFAMAQTLRNWSTFTSYHLYLSGDLPLRADEHHESYSLKHSLRLWYHFLSHSRLHYHTVENCFANQLLHLSIWTWKSRTRSNVSLPNMIVGRVQHELLRVQHQFADLSPHLYFDCLLPLLQIRNTLKKRNGITSQDTASTTTTTSSKKKEKHGGKEKQVQVSTEQHVPKYISRTQQVHLSTEIAIPYHRQRCLSQAWSHWRCRQFTHHRLYQKASNHYRQFHLKRSFACFRTQLKVLILNNKKKPKQALEFYEHRRHQLALRTMALCCHAKKVQLLHGRKIQLQHYRIWYILSMKQRSLRKHVRKYVDRIRKKELSRAWALWCNEIAIERKADFFYKEKSLQTVRGALLKLCRFSRLQYRMKMKEVLGMLRRRRLSINNGHDDDHHHHHAGAHHHGSGGSSSGGGGKNVLANVRQLRASYHSMYVQIAHHTYHVKQRTLRLLLKNLEKKYKAQETIEKYALYHRQYCQRYVLRQLYHLRRNRLATLFYMKSAFVTLVHHSREYSRLKKVAKADFAKSRDFFIRQCVKHWCKYTLQRQQHRQQLHQTLRTSAMTSVVDPVDYSYYFRQQCKTFFIRPRKRVVKKRKILKLKAECDHYVQARQLRCGLRHFFQQIKHELRVKRNDYIVSLLHAQRMKKRALRLWQMYKIEAWLKMQYTRLYDPYHQLTDVADVADGGAGGGGRGGNVVLSRRHNGKVKRAFQHLKNVLLHHHGANKKVVKSQQAKEGEENEDDGNNQHLPSSSTTEHGKDGAVLIEELSDHGNKSKKRTTSSNGKHEREQRRLAQFSLQ